MALISKTPQELKALREKANAFYRRINVVPPRGWNCTIFIGGCIERGVGSSFRASAHAHNNKKSDRFGCLCFRSIKKLGEYDVVENLDGTTDIIITKPGQLLMHEYAHLLAPNQGHNKTWLNRLRELGGRTKKYENRWKSCRS